MEYFSITVPARDQPRCACGATRVLLLREPHPAGDLLADNMGSDLAPERYAGPLCPRCAAEELLAMRARIARGQPPPDPAT